MGRLVCYIPPSSGVALFRDRIWHWGRLVQGNDLRKSFDVVLVMPEQYSGDEHLNLFRESEIEIYSEERHSPSQVFDLLENRWPSFCKVTDDTTFIVAGFFNPFVGKYPHALHLHFEMGIFSRPPMPGLVRYDSGGFFTNSVLASLVVSEGIPEEMVEILTEIAGCAERVFRMRANMPTAAHDRWYFEAPRERGPLLMFAAPPPGDTVTEMLVGAKLSLTEMIDRLTLALPAGSTLLVTRHPFDHDLIDPAALTPLNGIVVKFLDSVDGYSATNAFLPFVDGVVTVNSMVGFQGKLLRKRLYAYHTSFLGGVADSLFSFQGVNGEGGNLRSRGLHHRLTLGYILGFLHLPPKIWNAGFGRDYVEHLLRGGAATSLWRMTSAFEHLHAMAEYYQREIS